MINHIIVGICACLVTLGSVYFGVSSSHQSKPADVKAPSPEIISVKAITVPVVAPEGIEGYVIAILGYKVDREKLQDKSIDLTPTLRDESFRTLYGLDAVKYKKPRKSDLTDISKQLIEGVNKRLGGEVVKEVLVEELSYIPKEEVRGGRGGAGR